VTKIPIKIVKAVNKNTVAALDRVTAWVKDKILIIKKIIIGIKIGLFLNLTFFSINIFKNQDKRVIAPKIWEILRVIPEISAEPNLSKGIKKAINNIPQKGFLKIRKTNKTKKVKPKIIGRLKTPKKLINTPKNMTNIREKIRIIKSFFFITILFLFLNMLGIRIENQETG
jgi:uncharacterized membrane protein